MNTNMTPIDWAKRPLERYADFTGRAPRAEYWWFFLALIIFYIVVNIIESILGINRMVFGVYGPLAVLLWLATIVPSLAVGVRRLHDTNRSGWWLAAPIVPYALALVLGGRAIVSGQFSAGAGLALLLLFVGFICAIVLLIFMVLQGTPGENRFGSNPYGVGEAAVAAE
jgi:uncharacterized membrane protein YhaH (DUF805 family)